MTEFDRSMIFMPLAEAQRFFNKAGSVDVLEIIVDNPENVGAHVAAMKAAGIPSMHYVDWRQRNSSFFTVLEVERNMMFIILSIIVLVAAFNIISGLMMLVKDKGRDIGILRTMGASRYAVMRVFLITGASIGVVGTLGGCLLGILFCWRIDNIRQFVAWLTQTRLFDEEVYYLAQAPGRPQLADDRRHRRHGPDLLGAGNRLSFLARLPARSGRSASLRVRPVQDTHARPVLQLRDICRVFRQGGREINVLRGASADLYPGQAVALVGPSGAGKSTLLHIAGSARDGGRRPHLRQRPRLHRQQRQRAHARAPGRDGLHLPVPPAAARVLRARERGDPADDPRHVLGGRGAARQRAVGPARPRRAARSPTGAALGRRAAAHGDRPRARQPAQDPAGRRADRQPRPRHLARWCFAS